MRKFESPFSRIWKSGRSAFGLFGHQNGASIGKSFNLSAAAGLQQQGSAFRAENGLHRFEMVEW